MSNDIKNALNISTDLDKKSADFLSKAIAANGTDGFDYIKFRKALKAMEGLSMEEAQKFKSAFAAASTMGLTKGSLVTSAKHYKQVLLNEKSKFDEALANRVKDKIASKRDQVLKLEQRIDEMKKKITEIESKISDFQQKIDVADDSLEAEKQKIQLTQQNFETAYNAFAEVLKEDMERISKHI